MIGNNLDLHAPSKQWQHWQSLSPEEKKHDLYLRQVKLLKTFRSHNAISQAQYDRSFRDLTEKMGEGGGVPASDAQQN